jgi:hypothetical protein
VAIKPAINPGVAVAERPATLAGAMNFISGGQTLGTSIVASAANKIVGFQRGAAAVAPKAPDLGSIINTLSTNILSNVENKLQNVNQNIQNFIQKTFASQLGEYRNRINELTSNTPNKILQNFLSLYKEAIGYIQFLGNRKNIKRLGDNLQALQNVFSETFRVASLIRTTIGKIVNQLSNLPSASSGAGGINLDVNVPGGPLRRVMPGRGGMLKMLGTAGLLGGGAGLATNVISGMADPTGGEVQPDTSGVVSSIPTPLLDRFMEVLNRFDKALQNFQAPQKAPAAPRAPSSGEKPPDKGPGGPSGPGGTPDVTADTQEEKAWLQTLRSVEGTAGADGYGKVFGGQVVKELQEGKLTIEEAAKMSETGKLPDRLGGKQIAYGNYRGKVSGATGAYQFMPDTLRAAARRAGIDLNTPMTPEIQDKLALIHLRSIGVDPTKRATETTVRKAGGSAGWAGVHGESTGQTTRTVKQSLDIYNKFYGTPATGGPGEDVAKLEAQIRASTDKSQTMKGIAGEVAQPAVKSDQQSNVSIVPMVMGSAESNSTPTGSQVALPPIMSKGGVTIPFLSSSNEDNFFTILSKVVYNIVDG